ncbi:MAG TPA: ATP-binding protein, partial [Brevundimonas sp.]|nr:ATP-binding protein [Brevundimonas sp.]
ARILAEARGMEVVAELDPEVLRIEGDAGRLAQAFRIVLDNAVKYGDPGGRVEVGIRREGRNAVLRVANGGTTIPPADLPFVFNRFYRGRQDAPRRDGAGLGLPIAKWVLDTHGGRIELSSSQSRTEAVLTLPLKA